MIGPDRGAGLRAGADVPGALLITGAMMLGVFTIVDPAAQQGWLAAKTLGLGAGTLVLLGGFIIRQRTARNPLMPLRIFSSRNVTGANLVQMLGTAGMFGMFFLGSLYLRRILGYDPLQIGLAFLPVAVVMGTLSVRYTDRLVIRFGALPTMLTGLGLIAAGLALFATAPAGGGYLSHIFPVTVLAGTVRAWLPRPDGAGHVQRHPPRRRPGLRPGECDRPDRRRARARGASDRLRIAQQHAARPAPPGRRRAPPTATTWPSGSPAA